MKKITSAILAALMCLGCLAAFPQGVSAYDWGWISSVVKWNLYDNGLLNFSGTGLAYFGFYGMQSTFYEKITEITLSEGITGLIFQGENLPNLTKITLSSTCTQVDGTPYNSLLLEKYVVPSGNPAYKAKGGVLYERNKEENGTYKSTYTLKHYPAGITAEKYTMESTTTAVGEHSFHNNKHLKQLVFADAVTAIGTSALEGCTALVKVELPLSLETMGDHAFMGCSALTSVAITGRIKRLGRGAFMNCTALKTVSFPTTLQHLNSGCFANCTSLKKIDLKNIKSIGASGLYNCSSLEQLHIPAGLAFHSDYEEDNPTLYTSFLGNNLKLKSISVDSANPYYCSVDGVLYSKDKTHLYSYPAGRPDKEYTTLKTTEVIDNYAFSGAKNLESLTVYAETIWSYVFDGCDSVTKLAIKGKKLSYVSEFNFPSLKTLEFSDEITGSFETHYFQYCTNLPSEVVLPSGFYMVRRFSETMYSPFKTIYIFKTPELFKREEVGNIVYSLEDDKETLKKRGIDLIRLDESGICGENASFTLDKNGRLVITGTGAVDSYPWSEYSQFIKEVVVSEGISSIGEGAFAGCAVRTLTLPSSLAEVGKNAFDGCEGLNMVIDYTATTEIAEGNSALTAAQSVRLEKGDVNGDGVIDNFDASIILKYDAGITQALDNGDVNGDGVIDNFDASVILKYDAGIIGF